MTAAIPVVSPEFRLRPSLSGVGVVSVLLDGGRVAGVQTPAFVERRPRTTSSVGSTCGVAGVQTPAFVERICLRRVVR